MEKQQDGKRKVEIVDKRVAAQESEISASSTGGAEQLAAEAATFIQQSPQEGSAQRLRERDDAERFFTGGAHHSPARGTQADESPDDVLRAQEYLELAQRKEAEFRNYRQQERARLDDVRRYAIEAILEDLFPALDGLAHALAEIGPEREEDPVVAGMRKTAKALERALLKHGVQKIDEAGVAFDSALHQPVQVELSDQVIEDKVVEIFTAGYKLGETILKPAMVKVLQPDRSNAET